MKLFSYVPGTRAWQNRRDLALCRNALRRIDEIVDGELQPGRAAKSLKQHLEACERCGGEADVVHALKVAVARVGRDCDPDFVRRLEDAARKLCDGTR